MAKAAAKGGESGRPQAPTSPSSRPSSSGTPRWVYYKQGERVHYYALAGCLLVYKITLPMAIEASVSPEGLVTGYFFDVMVLAAVHANAQHVHGRPGTSC